MNSIELKNFKLSILAMRKSKTPIEHSVEQIFLAKTMSPRKEVWENLGFKFKESEETSLVSEAKLPAGWSIAHIQNYKFDITDNNGLIRAQMFYKEDPEGRSASMRLLKKYQVYSVSERREVKGKKDNVTVTVVYFGTEQERLYVAGELELEDYCSEEDLRKYFENLETAIDKATHYANSNYPDWKSPIAYWNEEPNKVMKLN